MGPTGLREGRPDDQQTTHERHELIFVQQHGRARSDLAEEGYDSSAPLKRVRVSEFDGDTPDFGPKRIDDPIPIGAEGRYVIAGTANNEDEVNEENHPRQLSDRDGDREKMQLLFQQQKQLGSSFASISSGDVGEIENRYEEHDTRDDDALAKCSN